MIIIKMLFTALLISVISISMPVQADVREVFVCNYLDGKDMGDVLSARDFYLKQAKKAGIEAPMSFVWTPYKSSADFDLLWFSNHENLAAFARQADASAASAEMAAVQDRFDTVVKCSSAIGSRELIFDGGEPAVTTPPALITSNACNLKPGVGREDLNDLWGHVREVLGGMDAYKEGIFYAYTPITTSPTTPDLFLYGVSDNVSAWASKRAAFGGSEAGPALGRHFEALMDCTNSLWIGQRVVPPAE